MKAHEILQTKAHRPWPMPEGAWLMRQHWNDLLFAHWALPPGALAGMIPPPLAPDVFEGRAWLAVTPFRMDGIRGRWMPPLPGLNAFHELNVRTYVIFGGKPGVYFFSLDAASRVAVQAARWSYKLPYHLARMHSTAEGEGVGYSSERVGGDAALKAHYAPTGAPRLREPGSLEHFLTERYCLYAVRGSALYRAEIHHVPWPLQDAEAQFEVNTMAQAAGIRLQGEPQVLHFAKKLEVLVWGLHRVQ